MDPPQSKRSRQEVLNWKSHVPVVVLTRLPDFSGDSQHLSTNQQFNSEVDSLSNSDSDVPWEPGNDSSDSDFAPENDKSKAAKSPKIDKTAVTKKIEAHCPNVNEKTNAAMAKTTTTTTKTTAANCPNADQTTSATTTTTATTIATAKKPTPVPLPSTTNGNNKAKVDSSPIIVSSVFSHGSQETTKVPVSLPEVEVKLDMAVLARRRPMIWHQGKVVEIVEKEDGRLKYKVSFGEKGRSLVSAHHLAFTTTPKLEQLYVGARVVIQDQEDKSQFQPGILAELPGRKNRLRFLIFLDDHTPMYVGLQVLHLIIKPLENTLDDIPDGPHKGFLKQYLKNWPYPHLTQYKVGQCVNAELEETMQECKIEVVDCSVMQVVFKENQQKEWLYRGSMRLEHMAKFLALREKQENQEKSSQ
ncbi:unnamed protein product [Ophioblennius macclurei]